MLIKDIMTKNVITASSGTSVVEAKKIMGEHKIRRLPVVDNGKLVGIVTEDKLEHLSHPVTAPTLWQINWLISKTTLGDIMERDVVTVEPEDTIEQALGVAQSHKVGAVVVVKNGEVVGMVTTNDVFYKVVNPTLGIGESGARIVVRNGGDGKAVEKIITCINKLGLEVKILWVIPSPITKRKDLVIQLETEDASSVIKELQNLGYPAIIRAR